MPGGSAMEDGVQLRAREGRRLLTIGVIINGILALVKIAGGLLGRSHALIADGVESSLDVLSSLMLWWAIRYAARPPDEEHPYGHGKMESLGAVGGSVLLLLAGAALGLHSLQEIIYLRHASAAQGNLPAGFTLIILLVTILTKESLYRWMNHRGKQLGSRAVLTDALHHRSDALTSLAAAVGISAALLGGPAWAVADDWAALFSCVLIVFNGLKMLRSAVGDVLDEQLPEEEIAKILAAALAVPGVVSLEKCRVRKSGLSRLADLHVRVDGECTVTEGHRISHEVKDRLLETEFHLTDVVVHIEPA